MENIRILDEKPLIVNEVINQEKALSKPNTSCNSKADEVDMAADDFIEGFRKRISEQYSLPKIQPTTRKELILDSSKCDHPNKKSLELPRWTQEVRIDLATGLTSLPDDGFSWRKYGQKEILGAKYPRSYFRCGGRYCPVKKQVQQLDVDPSILEVSYKGKHSCTQALHPILNLPSPNELNQNGQEDEEFLNSSDFIDNIAKDSDIQELKSSSSCTQAFNPIPDLPPPNEQNQQEILSHSNSKGCATTNPGTQSSQFQNQSETSKSKAETILMDMITGDASNPSTDPPHSNPEVEVGISYGKAIAPNVVTGDISSAASPPTGSPRSNPEVEVGQSNDSNRSDMYMKRRTLPLWTEQVRVYSGTGLEGAPPDDGYSWRKYGQKDILGAKYPRGFYRCTHKNTQGCLATKQVQRSEDDPSFFEVTYRGKHTCTPVSLISPPTELNLNGPKDTEFNSLEVIDEITKDNHIKKRLSPSFWTTLQLVPNQDLPPPNKQNQSQNKQEILSQFNSKGCATTNPGTQSFQFQSQSETLKSKAETTLMDMITRDASTLSTDPPQSNPEVDVGISYGKAIAPNVVTDDFSSAASTPSMGSPQPNPEVEVGISCGNDIAPNVVIDDITSAASTPLIGPPQSNPGGEEGNSCGKEVAPNVVTGDITSTASPPTGSPQGNPGGEEGNSCGKEVAPNVVTGDVTSTASPPTGPPQSNPRGEEGNSCGKEVAPNVVTGDVTSTASPPTGSPQGNPEVEIGILRDITSAASTPLTGSPRHNPEVEVGVSCGNIIAPNVMRGGFHNHIDDQDKQVQSSDANQTHFNSEILQVSETGTDVAVITGATMERKMDGKGKGSDSTNPRIESKPKSRHCCWFRCFCRCHCQVGVME